MRFGNPVVGGKTLIRSDIQSENYLAGFEGWAIYRNGDAEFNNVTIRGNIALSDLWSPVMSIYDTFNGAPSWSTTATYVSFTDSQFAPCDMVCPASGIIRWDLQIKGMNNNTAASTLSVDVECLESSGPPYSPGTQWVGPGTQIHAPNTQDAAWITSQVAGNAATDGGTAAYYVDGLTPGNWYRFKMYWRISSGSAATVTFPSGSSKIIVTPVV